MGSELNLSSSSIMRKCKRKRKRKKVDADDDDVIVDGNCCMPMELIEEILSWVPGKDVLRFKCVSRSWYQLVKDPRFIKLHCCRCRSKNDSLLLSSPHGIYTLDHHNQNHSNVSRLRPPPDKTRFGRDALVRVEGTCDGLICCRCMFSNCTNLYTIYNPTTGFSKTILEESLRRRRRRRCQRNYVLGFGYDGVSHDYKVLLLRSAVEIDLHFQYPSEFPSPDDGDRETNMYSLKTDAWEPVDNPPWDFWPIRHTSGPCVNNSFQWLVPNTDIGGGGKDIKCFNLHTRRWYSQMPLPEAVSRLPSTVLTVYNGKLCVCEVTDGFDIWVLKEYGNHESWARLFHNQSASAALTVSPNDVWCSKLRIACSRDQRNNFVLLVSHADIIDAPPASWFYCDLQSQITTKMQMPYFPKHLRLAALQPWVESLLPLH